MDANEQPVEGNEPAQEQAQEPIVGTLGLKLTLRGSEGSSKPTLEDLAESIKGWDLSQYGLSVSVTDIEWR